MGWSYVRVGGGEIRRLIGRLVVRVNRSPRERKLIGAPSHITGTLRFLASNCHGGTRRIVGGTVFAANSGSVIVIHSVRICDVYRRRVVPFFNHYRVNCITSKGILKISGLTEVVSLCTEHLRVRRHLARRVTRRVEHTINTRKINIIVRYHRLYVVVQNIRGRGSIVAASTILNSFHHGTTAHTRFVGLLG